MSRFSDAIKTWLGVTSVENSGVRPVPTNVPHQEAAWTETGGDATLDPLRVNLANSLSAERSNIDIGSAIKRAVQYNIDVFSLIQRIHLLAQMVEHKAVRREEVAEEGDPNTGGRYRERDDTTSVGARVLKKVNHDGRSFSEVFASALCDYLLYGECTVYLRQIATTRMDSPPGGVTTPDMEAGLYEFVRLDPNLVESKLVREGDWVITRYEYDQMRVANVELDGLKLIHIRNYNPLEDTQRGLSPMTAMDNAMLLSQLAKASMARGVAQRDQIDALIMGDSIQDENVKEMETRLRQRFSVRKLFGPRLLVLTGQNLKVANLQQRDKDEFMSQADELISEDVLNGLLGIHKMLDHRATPEEQREATQLAYETIIIPFAQMFHAHLTSVLRNSVAKWGPSNFTTYTTSRVSVLWGVGLDRTRTLVASVNSNLITPDEGRAEMNLQPHNSAYTQEFGQMMSAQISAALNVETALGSAEGALTGSEGGRDQTSKGEARMVDKSGQKGMR